MSNLSEESLIFSFKTIQCTAFRILIEGMKEILNETNMIFDEGGIKILTTDNSHSVLVHVKLEGQHFEEYICNQKTMIGINLFYFYKLIRGIGNNDTLSVYMAKDNLNCIFIKIENSEKNFVTNFKFHLLDLQRDIFKIPDTEFEAVVAIPTNDFQKICKNMATNIGEKIEIKLYDHQLIMSTSGDHAEQTTVLNQNASGMRILNQANENPFVQGVYSLKHLVLFTKCTNLCNNVEIFLKNDFPIILQYHVSTLGIIRLGLAPILE